MPIKCPSLHHESPSWGKTEPWLLWTCVYCSRKIEQLPFELLASIVKHGVAKHDFFTTLCFFFFFFFFSRILHRDWKRGCQNLARKARKIIFANHKTTKKLNP